MTETLAPPRRTAILHVGPMKTGSTSIQWWLGQHREALKDLGVVVPLAEVTTNLSRLAALFNGDRDASEGDAVSLQTLTAELAALSPEVHTCVLSGELLAGSMRIDGIKRLCDTLSPFFDEFRIVLYLRRQDEMEASRLSTLLRRGVKRRFGTSPFDYEESIARWAGVFGREAMRPRLFARDALVDGDVVSDFIAVAGLPSLPQSSTQRNASINPVAQALLDKLGRRYANDRGATFRAQPSYPDMIAMIDAQFAGTGALPTRRKARKLVAKAEASNERVRAEWFPAQARLFSDDFSRYPEEEANEPPAEDQLEAALAVIVHLLAGEGEPRAVRREKRTARRRERAASAKKDGEAAAGERRRARARRDA